MKKLVYSTREDFQQTIHFTDLFDRIGLVVYVDDINCASPIWGSSYFETDYSSCSDDDLAGLDISELNQISDLHTIYRLNQICPEKLTLKQKRELAKMYRIDPNDLHSSGIRVYLDNSDVSNILDMLKEHKYVQGPVYRHNAPEKNFAIKHNLNIGPQDYAHILHSLTVDECSIRTPYKTLSYSDKNPGAELIVFSVRKTFTLLNGQKIGNFSVYIKIDLTKTAGDDNSPIALISFHE